MTAQVKDLVETKYRLNIVYLSGKSAVKWVEYYYKAERAFRKAANNPKVKNGFWWVEFKGGADLVYKFTEGNRQFHTDFYPKV